MTRKELGLMLLEDETRWDEEVCCEDLEHSISYKIMSCKSIQVDELQNGNIVRAQFPSRFCDDRFLNRSQITILD